MVARDAFEPVGTLLHDRLLTMVNSQSVLDTLPHIDRQYGGLVLTGVDAPVRCREIRNAFPDLVVAMDHESHVYAAATADAPFGIRTRNGFQSVSGSELSEVLEGQLLNKTSFAVTPTCFIHHDDEGDQVIRAVVSRANALDRTDTVVLLPVSYKWLQSASLPRLAAQIWTSRHPVALIMQSDRDPLIHRGVVEGLRQLCRSCPGLLVWRTDLAAFDAMVHGALGAAVGATAGLRHGVDPLRTGGGGSWKPFTSVLAGRLLRYVRVATLQDWFAHSEPWTCNCPVCQGATLTRFTDKPSDTIAAAQHSARELYALHQELTATVPGGDRLEWWRQLLDDAFAYHRDLALQAEMEIAVPSVLRAWRQASPLPLPRSHERPGPS
ncbi:hypothetical protein [Streptomyces sp. NBC_01481]|uniref:hypothetical protein n=1 Tax=Streptomyces sp. NBC_01481 TaxID=2975869 RepID=UPI00225C0587|nr:hypothetical protein [Streptomyces sp. NBC_01481]MCX4587033.1 hypothetical protein [Streptomyces sp. NBC_01481]